MLRGEYEFLFGVTRETAKRIGRYEVNGDQIDWNSDSFENFVRLPSEHPLIGAGFANIEGENLLSRYEAGLVFGPIEVGAMTDKLSDGTYTFWWKEGANKVSYVLNFVVEEI